MKVLFGVLILLIWHGACPFGFMGVGRDFVGIMNHAVVAFAFVYHR